MKAFVLAALTLSLALGARSEGDRSFVDNLEFQSVFVADHEVALRNHEASLGPNPKGISFNFHVKEACPATVTRLRYRMEGYETDWHDGDGSMNLIVRFYNASGDSVGNATFSANGDSPGWNGSLETSSMTQRDERVVAPPEAASLMVIITSAGPPETIGTYAIANLIISRIATNLPPIVIMESPFNNGQPPVNWKADGIKPSMARIASFGPAPSEKAFAIFDNDNAKHAEWHNTIGSNPKVQPGDIIRIKWDEMYSTGLGNLTHAFYHELPAGKYLFHVADFDIAGRQTGSDAYLAVLVPEPLWRKPSFWALIAIIIVSTGAGIDRYKSWRRLRLEATRLQSQRLFEQERLRIARDIHDDVGARVTEISIMSTRARKMAHPPKPQTEALDQISILCGDLILALYETVWTISPENDNLEALGHHLCQITNRICGQKDVPCRLNVSHLPKAVEISAHVRHCLTRAVIETVRSAVKRHGVSEVTLSMEFTAPVLNIQVRNRADNSISGLHPSSPPETFSDLQHRIADLGGICVVESCPGGENLVRFQLCLTPPTSNT